MRLQNCALLLALATAIRAFSQTTVANAITNISPASAAPGTSGLLVTLTLNAGVTPPVPPANVAPTSVTLGTNVGTAVTHASQHVVTAQFNLPINEPAGLKDVAVTFPRPAGGPVTYNRLQAFQVVAGSALSASFSTSPRSGSAPLTVSFSDTSTGVVTNRLWAFGDGTGSLDANPLHIYTNAGTYSVSLTILGPGGSNTLTRGSFITATPPMTNLGAYPIVDTAQASCFNNSTTIPAPVAGQPFGGQDAQHSSHSPACLDNGDGTVSDLVTGLMWQQDPGAKVTFAAATNGAKLLVLGGHSDWRTPTIKELYSLILFTGLDASPCMAPGAGACGAVPFLDTNYFAFEYGNTNAGERIIDAQYWSSTEYGGTTMGGNATVFGVNFADGRIKGYPRDIGPGGTATQFCRYVRGNPAYAFNNFTNHDDGTITDQATWLMWAQADSGTGLNWSNALAWVQARNAAGYLGYHDWRLPDVKELQSLVDYSRSPDTTASAAINPQFSSTSLINEAGQLDWPAYWSSTTHEDANHSGAWGAYVCFGRGMGYWNSAWTDVHGAGCQRSDPKTGSASDYPTGHGPQGDSVRVTNFVRLVRTTAANADTIGDGLPDWWRRQFFGSPTQTNSASCAACDADHDGATNAAEFGAGTNPTNAASVLRLSAEVIGSGQISLTWEAVGGRSYQVYQATNFGSSIVWMPASGTLSNGQFTGAAPTCSRTFYRVRVVP
jgi:PKD repeat protein